MAKYTGQKDEAMQIAIQFWANELKEAVENMPIEKKKRYIREFRSKSLNHAAAVLIAFPETYRNDLEAICEITGAKSDEWLGGDRRTVNVGTRKIMSYIWHNELELGPVHISRIMNLDHATIHHYLETLPMIWEGDYRFHQSCINLFREMGHNRCLERSMRVKNLFVPKSFR